jgi:molybdopterin-synthase adenylyltransferase
MLDTSEKFQIFSDLTELNHLKNPHFLSTDELKKFASRKIDFAVKGQVLIDEEEVTLCIGTNHTFPLSLPIVFLQPADTFGIIPHLEGDGCLCYLDPEGLLLNSEKPVEILVEAIERSITLLQNGIRGLNKQDFMDEFRFYWQRAIAEPKSLCSFIFADNTLRQIFAYKETGKDFFFAADSIDVISAYFNSESGFFNSYTRHNALYIPLESGTILIPPQRNKPWSLSDIQEILRKHLSIKNQKLLKKYQSKKKKKEQLVVLGLPRSNGGRTLIGFVFNDIANDELLLINKSKNIPSPIIIYRYDADYLITRGGADIELSKIHSLVVGCGSVGSNIVMDLIQSGITHLTLVDPDILSQENTFRHVLGHKSQFKAKVEALKEEIKSKYPYVSINICSKRIETAIQEKMITLSKFDCIFLATGNHTIELYLNRMIRQLKNNPVTIFAWLEPYSIGGHTLLTHPQRSGCLQCLFTSDSHSGYYNKASFAASGQSFAKNDLGCNGSYVFYGALDARKTAEQSVRLALDSLRKYEQENPIISWKGSNNLFIKEGFKTSPRYQLSTDLLQQNKYAYINPDCPVCGGQNKCLQ